MQLNMELIGLLIALSVWSVAVAVERWLYYRRVDLSQFSDAQTFEMALTKRLVIIGTVAANAPYIGLLGTSMRSDNIPYHGHIRHDGRQYHHDPA